MIRRDVVPKIAPSTQCAKLIAGYTDRIAVTGKVSIPPDDEHEIALRIVQAIWIWLENGELEKSKISTASDGVASIGLLVSQ